MPYLALVRRRRVLRGLGDTCNGAYTVTDQSGNNIPLASLYGVALSQFLNAVSVGAGGEFCLPSGQSMAVQVNTSGGSGDLPSWSGFNANPAARPAGHWQPMSQAIQKAQTTFNEFLNPALLVNTTPTAGGVVSSSLPANFQATPAQIAAAANTYAAQAAANALLYPSNKPAAAPVVMSSAAPPAGSFSSSGIGPTLALLSGSSSSGIPSWVWIAGGAALLLVLFMGGKK